MENWLLTFIVQIGRGCKAAFKDCLILTLKSPMDSVAKINKVDWIVFRRVLTSRRSPSQFGRREKNNKPLLKTKNNKPLLKTIFQIHEIEIIRKQACSQVCLDQLIISITNRVICWITRNVGCSIKDAMSLENASKLEMRCN